MGAICVSLALSLASPRSARSTEVDRSWVEEGVARAREGDLSGALSLYEEGWKALRAERLPVDATVEYRLALWSLEAYRTSSTAGAARRATKHICRYLRRPSLASADRARAREWLGEEGWSCAAKKSVPSSPGPTTATPEPIGSTPEPAESTGEASESTPESSEGPMGDEPLPLLPVGHRAKQGPEETNDVPVGLDVSTRSSPSTDSPRGSKVLPLVGWSSVATGTALLLVMGTYVSLNELKYKPVLDDANGRFKGAADEVKEAEGQMQNADSALMQADDARGDVDVARDKVELANRVTLATGITGGLLLGTGVAILVTRSLRQKRYALTPSFGPKGGGLAFRVRF